MKEKKKYWTTMKTPYGELFIAGRDGKLTDVLFRRPRKGFPGPLWERSDRQFTDVKKQLKEYFSGKRKKELRCLGYGHTYHPIRDFSEGPSTM